MHKIKRNVELMISERERESRVPTAPLSVHNSNHNSIQTAYNHICYKTRKFILKDNNNLSLVGTGRPPNH
jgi:hypothetical protein